MGKSSFCKYLAELGWLYLEADQKNVDGIDALGLRAEWNEFYGDHKYLTLAQKLQALGAEHKGVVLSLPSAAIPKVPLIRASNEFLGVRFLWGDPRWCLRDFLARERATGRNLPASHWDAHNKGVYSTLCTSEYQPLLIDVFDSSGRRLPYERIEEGISFLEH